MKIHFLILAVLSVAGGSCVPSEKFGDIDELLKREVNRRPHVESSYPNFSKKERKQEEVVMSRICGHRLWHEYCADASIFFDEEEARKPSAYKKFDLKDLPSRELGELKLD